jgi:hypothetical protein
VKLALLSAVTYVLLGVGSAQADTYTKTYSTGDIAATICCGHTSDLVIADRGQITDINVRVRVQAEAGNGSPYGLALVAPDGTKIPLATQKADWAYGSGGCAGTMVFDDAAPGSIADGSSPFTGSFRPQSPLSALNGKAVNGTWGLRIVGTDQVFCFELEITRAANIVTGNDPGKAGAAVSYSKPNGFSPCLPASGSFFSLGTTIVSCFAPLKPLTHFTVKVEDTQPPTITAPNITKSNDPGQPGAVVSYPAPAVTDNVPGVGSPTCSPASGSFFPLGTTTVTCTVADAAGNSASATFTVTVNDTEPPTLATSPDLTRKNDPDRAGAVVTYSPPVAKDNAPGVTASCAPPSGNFFPLGATTVTCTAKDAAGNMTKKTFKVTVADAQPPTLTVSPDLVVGADPGKAGAVVNYPPPIAADNAPGVGTPTCNPPSGSLFPLGTTTTTCSVKDAAGNTAEKSFKVTVTAGKAPPPTGAKCMVPSLKGKTLPAAKLLLGRAHCALGTVRRAHSAKVKKGRVISQAPAAGRRLPNRAKVNLLVSRGRQPKPS